MAFEGDLRNLELGDVFQTLAMTRQQGTLVLRRGEERRLAFGERGIALLSARQSHGERIAKYLLGKQQIGTDHLEAARKAIRRNPSAALDEALEELDACDPQHLAAARKYMALDDVYELFSWREGTFEFLADEMEATGRFAEYWFDVGSIAMEAARRMDELPRLEELVPAGEVLTQTTPGEMPDPEAVGPTLASLYPLVTGFRTVAEIQEDFHLGPFDARKALASLMEKGLVRAATQPEVIAAAEAALEEHGHEKAADLLRRAIVHDPQAEELREALAQSLVEADRKREAAAVLVDLARQQAARSGGPSAKETFRRAIKLDSENCRAHEGLALALFASGAIEPGIEAARATASACLAAKDFERAVRVAENALGYRADDVALRMSLANALLGAGNTDGALGVLDAVATSLQASGSSQRKLVEVYRAILRLDPGRRDCARRIEQIQEHERLRRRRLAQRMIVAAIVVVAAGAAVPFMRGPSVESNVQRAYEFLVENNVEDAVAILDRLERRSLDADEGVAVANLRYAVERALEPRQVKPIHDKLIAIVEPFYQESSRAEDDKRMSDALALLEKALDTLDGPAANDLDEISPETLARMRKECEGEVQIALSNLADSTISDAVWVSGVRDAFTNSAAFRRAEFTVDADDLQALQELIGDAEKVRAIEERDDWAAIAGSVRRLVDRTSLSEEGNARRVLDAIESLREMFPHVAENGDRALAHAHRTQLMTRFRDAKQRGADLERTGSFEDASELYRGYLAFCTEVRAGRRGEVYHEIVDRYLETLPLEQVQRERLEQLEESIRLEKAAEESLAAGDYERAFRIRVDLVRDYPSFGFEYRFQLPLRLETRPSGAEVHVLSEEGVGQLVGTTPMTVPYQVHGTTRIAIRKPGFEQRTIQREGAVHDDSGHLVMDLVKQAVWRSQPGAATEAAPVVTDESVIVASRDGVVRALSRKDGIETARFETQLLGGISASPVLRNGRVHVAAIDGVGFVLDATTLSKIHRYVLPAAVRAGLVAIPGGVLVMDDSGVGRVVADDGSTVWQKKIGKTAVRPAVAGGHVVVCTVDGVLVSLDARTGDERWRIALPHHTGWAAPLVDGARAYVGCAGGKLYCVDMRSAEIVWEAELGAPVTARPARSGSAIVVGNRRGDLQLLDPASGDIASTVSVGAGVSEAVVDLDDGFVLVTRNGVVRRFTSGARLEWSYETGERVDAPPVAIDDRIIVVTHGGRVIALER